MADEHLYASVEDVVRYMRGSLENEALVGVIAMLIDPVSRRIDQHCRRHFYAKTETHLYDFQKPDRLWLKRDLLSVTTLTNGDDQVLTADQYFLYPDEGPPYRYIDINRQAGIYFTWSGTYQKCISVAGTWGYSTIAPPLVNVACCAWISYLIMGGSANQEGGVQSKMIGDFQVTYSPSTLLTQLQSTPAEVKSFLSGFIYRDYASMGGAA